MRGRPAGMMPKASDMIDLEDGHVLLGGGFAMF